LGSSHLKKTQPKPQQPPKNYRLPPKTPTATSVQPPCPLWLKNTPNHKPQTKKHVTQSQKILLKAKINLLKTKKILLKAKINLLKTKKILLKAKINLLKTKKIYSKPK